MKNVFLFFVTHCIFLKHFHAFHKESYYGDPYSMEYVGKYSTVNLTKDDILFADYIVEMLRNTSYSTIDFNASMTYPSRFQHLYETGVPTVSTRRFATTSTKSPTTEKMWANPQNEHFFGISDLWETPNSISFQFSTVDVSRFKQQKKSRSSLSLNEIENAAPLCTKMSEDRLASVRDIIRRSIIKKTTGKYTQRYILPHLTEERKKHSFYHTSDCSTTRKRRSIPFHLDSDSGPWLTSKEQEQMWALRGTSLLDSEKYDFPFPYDFDKWPGCTTKDLTDPKNTVQVLQYENGHVRFIGVSKPGWNEFPWKPTEFTTAYPAYRRLDKYLTYLSRPWYGYYSTLNPPLSKKWDKRTTRAWSRYTFVNHSRKSKYEMGKLAGSKKWIIDRWPPDWNRTIYPQSSASTWKRTWWGGKWHLPTPKPLKPNANITKPNVDFSRLNTNTMTPYSETSKPRPDTKNPPLDPYGPRKPILSSTTKSTTGFGFLSISPTWYALHDISNNTFRYPNATWVSEWNRLYSAASFKSVLKTRWAGVWNSTLNSFYQQGQWNKKFSLPLYTYAKTTWSKEWPNDWLNQWEKNNTITWSKTFYTKPSQSQSKYWNREHPDKQNIVNPREWSASAKQNIGGWSLPALTKAWTQSGTWSKTWYANRGFQQLYSNQLGGGGLSNMWNKQVTHTSGRAFYSNTYQRHSNQLNKVVGYPISRPTIFQTQWNGEKFQKQSPWSQQYRGVPETWTKTWTNQWNIQQPQTWSRTWYTKPFQQFHSRHWGGGRWSNALNRGVPSLGSRAFYTNTKSYQQYSNQNQWNQRNIEGHLNQWNAEKPREWNPWSTQHRGGWSQAWTKSWNQKQSPIRSKTLYTKP